VSDAKRPRRIAELGRHPRNPREMSLAASQGLRESEEVFGDLSGITYNGATGHLISGHQRSDQLEDLEPGTIRWGRPYTVELGYPGRRFESVERDGWVKLPSGARFRIRLVRWEDEDFEKAAMLTANNPAIMGEFTDEATALLAELRASIPDLAMEDLGLDELLDDLTADLGDDEDDDEEERRRLVPEVYQVVVECESEAEQQRLFDRLTAEGLTCHVQVL